MAYTFGQASQKINQSPVDVEPALDASSTPTGYTFGKASQNINKVTPPAPPQVSTGRKTAEILAPSTTAFSDYVRASSRLKSGEIDFMQKEREALISSKDPKAKTRINEIDTEIAKVIANADKTNGQKVGMAIGTGIEMSGVAEIASLVGAVGRYGLRKVLGKAASEVAPKDVYTPFAGSKTANFITKATTIAPKTAAEEAAYKASSLGSKAKVIAKDTAKLMPESVGFGYGYDVSMGLQEGEGTESLKPGAMTAIGAALPVAIGGTRLAKNAVVPSKAKAIDSLEQTYADLMSGTTPGKKKISKIEQKTEMMDKAGTTGKTPMRTLAEGGIIPKRNGPKLDTFEQAQEYRSGITYLKDANKQALEEVGLSSQLTKLDDLEASAIKYANSQRNIDSGRAPKMVKEIQKEFEYLREAYPEGVIPIGKVDEIKSARWDNVFGNKGLIDADVLKKDSEYAIAKAMQKHIEEVADVAGNPEVAQLNREIGDRLEAAKFLEDLNGKTIKGGRLLKYMTTGIGATLGNTVPGKILGALGGNLAGEIIIATNISGPMKRLILRNLSKQDPAAYTKTIEWLSKQKLDKETRLLLPAPKTTMMGGTDIKGNKILPSGQKVAKPLEFLPQSKSPNNAQTTKAISNDAIMPDSIPLTKNAVKEDVVDNLDHLSEKDKAIVEKWLNSNPDETERQLYKAAKDFDDYINAQYDQGIDRYNGVIKYIEGGAKNKDGVLPEMGVTSGKNSNGRKMREFVTVKDKDGKYVKKEANPLKFQKRGDTFIEELGFNDKEEAQDFIDYFRKIIEQRDISKKDLASFTNPTLKNSYGAVAGIQVDEDGNVTFSPEMAAIGMIGGHLAPKMNLFKEAKGSTLANFLKVAKTVAGKSEDELKRLWENANKGGLGKAKILQKGSLNQQYKVTPLEQEAKGKTLDEFIQSGVDNFIKENNLESIVGIKNAHRYEGVDDAYMRLFNTNAQKGGSGFDVLNRTGGKIKEMFELRKKLIDQYEKMQELAKTKKPVSGFSDHVKKMAELPDEEFKPFVFKGQRIENPYYDETGRFIVNPETYYKLTKQQLTDIWKKANNTGVENPATNLADAKQALREAKGLSASDIMSKHADIQLKRDVPVTDVRGNKAVIPEGEALTPYELKGNKVLLQDGETYIVSKNQYQNIKSNAITGEKPKNFFQEFVDNKVEERVYGKSKDFTPEQKTRFKELEKEQASIYKEKDDLFAKASIPFSDVQEARLKELNNQLDKINAEYQPLSAIKNTRQADPTTYHSYTLPGGTNYKEILIKAPNPLAPTISVEDYIKKYREIFPDSRADDRMITNYWKDGNALPKAKGLSASTEGVVFKSSHWEDPNVLSHVRMAEHTYNGKKVTFLEEIQSDWAREGRSKGFIGDTKVNPKLEAKTKLEEKGVFFEQDMSGEANMVDKNGELLDYDELPEGTRTLVDIYTGGAESYNDLSTTGIPNHPLLKNWQEMSIKRALKEAVDNDAEYFAWINGAQTKARYNLSKDINDVSWGVKNGERNVRLSPKSGSEIRFSVDSNGVIGKDKTASFDVPSSFKGKRLDEVIGKGLADKIMADESGKLAGEGLNFGGEWAEALYDRQVPNIVKDLTGAKVETLDMGLPVRGKSTNDVNWVDLSNGKVVKPEGLKKGMEISGNPNASEGQKWIITDITGEGKFKAVPKVILNQANSKDVVNVNGLVDNISTQVGRENFYKRHGKLPDRYFQEEIAKKTESFDISTPKSQGQMGIKLTPEIKAMIRGEAPQIKKSSGKSPFELPKPKVTPLEQEAKGKTLDEFVKAQGKTVYHGTNFADDIEKGGFNADRKMKENSPFLGDDYVNGTYFTRNKKLFDEGGSLDNVGSVLEAQLPKNIKLLKVNSPKDLEDIVRDKYNRKTLPPTEEYHQETVRMLTEDLQSMGYDGVEIPSSDELIIFNPTSIKTKSQLTDIWKKANNKVDIKPFKAKEPRGGNVKFGKNFKKSAFGLAGLAALGSANQKASADTSDIKFGEKDIKETKIRMGKYRYDRTQEPTMFDGDALLKAIANNETGTATIKDPYSFNKWSDPKAGPLSKYGKDLGKYQITSARLKEKSKQFLGRVVTEKEFLSSPELQDKFIERQILWLKNQGLTPEQILAVHRHGWGDLSKKAIERALNERKSYVDKAVSFIKENKKI